MFIHFNKKNNEMLMQVIKLQIVKIQTSLID